MSKVGLIILGTAATAGLVAISLAAKKEAGENLKYEAAGLRFLGMQGLNPNLELVLQVRNNRSASVKLNSIDLSILKEDGGVLAVIRQYYDSGKEFIVEGNKINYLMLPIQTSGIRTLVFAISTLIKGWKEQGSFQNTMQGLRLQGEVKAEGIVITINSQVYYA